MKIGSLEWARVDALRRVSNSLHCDLRLVRDDIAKYERGLSTSQAFERRILGDIEMIRQVSDELRKEYSR